MPRIVVVKLGTNLVTNGGGTPDTAVLSDVARQVGELWQTGRRVVIVSSGAVGIGASLLKLGRRPRDLSVQQAAAAVGQPALMNAWSAAFAEVGLAVGQVLLTREDADERGRFLNLRNTIHALWRMNAVPIVNENDTVSTAEIRGGGMGAETFGDNDRLAAVVAGALSAELLVMLTTVDGLQDASGEIVSTVESLRDAAIHVRTGTSAGGTGGMASKLAAAALVTRAGETMVLANGRQDEVLLRAVGGEPIGTRFLPSAATRFSGRSRWIASAEAAGQLVLDAGAANALRGGSASLLPAGMTKIIGDFSRGDVVELVDADGAIIGRGLTNFDAATAARIAGKRSADLGALLSAPYHEEVVHRDHLVLTS